jgi:hypothetical protein
MSADIPAPWREFLSELDQALAGMDLDTPVELHCLGGFADGAVRAPPNDV